MKDVKLKPYKLDTVLTGFMPVPREVLELELPSTAILLYGLLLDRATLSQKNGYADPGGWVYVIYPVERLADTLHISDTAVKRHLKELEDKGLIRRRREIKNGASHIYLCLPTGSIRGTKCPGDIPKTHRSTGTKVPPNNHKKQTERYNDYQCGEDESL